MGVRMAVMFVVARGIGAGLGGERGLMAMNLCTQLPGHLDDDVVVPDPQGAIWKNLDRDVAITDVPSDPGGFGEFVATQIRNRLYCCDDPHVPAVFQYQAIAFAKVHGLGEIQEERVPLVGGRAEFGVGSDRRNPE